MTSPGTLNRDYRFMLPRLFILFITIPVLELCLFFMVGQRIGFPMTLIIIIATAFLGAYLTKSQGLKAFARYRESLEQGRVPHDAIIDSLLILVAGALLITPGFLTDSIGFTLLVPACRMFVRELIEKSIRKKFAVVGQAVGAPVRGNEATKRQAPQVITIEAEVVEITTDRTNS